jgi:hypothetical protein
LGISISVGTLDLIECGPAEEEGQSPAHPALSYRPAFDGGEATISRLLTHVALDTRSQGRFSGVIRDFCYNRRMLERDLDSHRVTIKGVLTTF